VAQALGVRRLLIRRGVALVLNVSAWLAREPGRERCSLAWSRWLARRMIDRRRIGIARSVHGLGIAWQAGFPSARQVPITRATADTVEAEIRTPCPLRGSGDTHACYRMMAYDRTIAGAAGGQFIVLTSQAEPGVTACRVALRFLGAPRADLIDAHLRAPGGRA
jgi:hypothetical protein